jgi:Lon protease-like protein
MSQQTLPLFPLPLVMLPGQSLPLHVFEPRYRAMVAWAKANGERIGLATLAGGADSSAAQAEIYPVLTVARLLGVQPLEDGRSNILLRYESRARMVEESLNPDGFRVARVDTLPEVTGPVRHAPWLRALLAQLASGSASARSSFAKLSQREDEEMLHVLADLVLVNPADRMRFLCASAQHERGELVQRRLAERAAASLQPAGEA